MCVVASGAGRGVRGTAEDEEGAAVFMTDQDEDDDHVKLLNPVKVHTLQPCCIWLLPVDNNTVHFPAMCIALYCCV